MRREERNTDQISCEAVVEEVVVESQLSLSLSPPLLSCTHYTTLHYTTLHYTLHYTTHYTPLTINLTVNNQQITGFQVEMAFHCKSIIELIALKLFISEDFGKVKGKKIKFEN